MSRVARTYAPPRMQSVARPPAFRQCPNLAAAVLRHRRAPRQRRTHLKQIRTLPIPLKAFRRQSFLGDSLWSLVS